MKLSRRAWLSALPAAWWGADVPAAPEDDDPVRRGRVLRFPRDHGAHLGSRIEWWYVTGWLDRPGAPLGFQITFFRHRTGLADALPGRFAPRQLLFAHAAISDIAAGAHPQAQRITRWNGDPAAAGAAASSADTQVHIGRWRFARDGATDSSRYLAQVGGGDATFDLGARFSATQPLLLQGDAGWSRKGPLARQASHYYSWPQLAVDATLTRERRTLRLAGRAWLDHEWSDEVLPPEAVGWDWIGINLADGGALMAFRLRRRDGSALWAGGSHRRSDGTLRMFEPPEVTFTPLREWASPVSQGRYPVDWRIGTPAGTFELRALMDAQELDGRSGTGAVYWEGLSDLFDGAGRAVGRGYLEMTGYAKPLTI